MSTRFLAWYTSGIMSLASFLMLFISVTPEAQVRFSVMQAIIAGVALFFAAAAVVLTRLPNEHWGNRSFLARCLFLIAAASSSLLVAISVG